MEYLYSWIIITNILFLFFFLFRLFYNSELLRGNMICSCYLFIFFKAMCILMQRSVVILLFNEIYPFSIEIYIFNHRKGTNTVNSYSYSYSYVYTPPSEKT